MRADHRVQREAFLATKNLKSTPPGFWTNTSNHIAFFDWLFKQVGAKCMEDWYKVTAEDILSYGGGGLLNNYKNSPSKALQRVYPQHKWELWRFKTPWILTSAKEVVT